MEYADTSFLVSTVLRDANTERALSLVGGLRVPLPFHRLLELEVWNAIRLCVFDGRMKEADARKSEWKIGEYLDAGVWEWEEMDWERVFARARGLSLAHTVAMGARTLDIFQVACAMELGARVFWSFDGRQRDLALAVGLRVVPEKAQ